MLPLIFLVATAFLSQTYGATSDQERLAGALLDDYVSFVNPDGAQISAGYALVSVNYDADSNTLTSHIWERYSWTDSRLAWDPSEYGDVSEISLPSNLIWTPDIMSYYPLDSSEERREVNVVLSSNGGVFWVPPTISTTRCFPPGSGNTVNCTLVFGSWTYNSIVLPLSLNKAATALDVHTFDARFSNAELVSTSLSLHTESYDGKPYTVAVANIVIRKSHR